MQRSGTDAWMGENARKRVWLCGLHVCGDLGQGALAAFGEGLQGNPVWCHFQPLMDDVLPGWPF